jgi:alpha-L-fucosidase
MQMSIDRRNFVAASLAMASAPGLARGGDLAPDWTSVSGAWQPPDWFRDAKFGIWAHWSAQCVPEQGDWYGRLMYVPGERAYEHHLKAYGHPADRGFMEIENLWKAEHWDPAYLVRRYKAAGAKYFMALGCHHDNLDTFDSAHHAWNTLRVGPKRDIVGTWEKIVRAEGLRFGVSNHSSHAWHWWQTAYGYDTRGPRAGDRYDAFKLRKDQGRGQWWDGLDPQELYVGPSFVPPDNITSDAAMKAWHEVHDGRWLEFAPPGNPDFVAKWLLRQNDLVDKYRPDMIYFDDSGLPFGSTGLAAVAHYYSKAVQWHGSPDVVVTAKVLSAYQRRAITEDIERGFSDRLRTEPWQTCTCIGDWHYNRARFDEKSYVPAEQVVQRLIDTVSKNGNLLLSIPLRGDGTIDSEEEKILDGITAWMRVNGDAAIHGSRPWRVYGEGPTDLSGGMFSEGKAKGFTPQDVRFTVKGQTLNAILMKWPGEPVRIRSLGRRALGGATVTSATLLGGGEVSFVQSDEALTLTLPNPSDGAIAPVVQLHGGGLTV